ncbi:MAG TPA: hydrolase [Thermoguttaceae bacterium]|nr:hydrolase [Thermoguttaceae bacterium]
MNEGAETCCARFDPGPWDEKEITWEGKKFVKARVRSFFHVPLNFAAVMKRAVGLIEAADAKPEAMIVLADETSLWGADVYIDVTRDVPGAQMATLSGSFLSKVFEGPYKNIGTWIREMGRYVKSQGKDLEKLYFYYTTCPKCAKKYGKNYVVLLAQV